MFDTCLDGNTHVSGRWFALTCSVMGMDHANGVAFIVSFGHSRGLADFIIIFTSSRRLTFRLLQAENVHFRRGKRLS